jgi:hypothetical protein
LWQPKDLLVPDNGAERRACRRTSPCPDATADGRRIHISRDLPLEANSHPAGSGGDRSGADYQKNSNAHNFTHKSKIDHSLLVECPFISRSGPTPPGCPTLPGRDSAGRQKSCSVALCWTRLFFSVRIFGRVFRSLAFGFCRFIFVFCGVAAVEVRLRGSLSARSRSAIPNRVK